MLDEEPSTENQAQGWFAYSSYTSALAYIPRHLVSGSKRRTQVEGFDLDLTYITARIIALGLPASGIEKLYRNPLSEVRAFLDSKHRGKYAMVNLCDERDYANADWPTAARVMRFPFADHHPCTLAALHAFCMRASYFLAADDKHVLAVHCKAGKGRTGVMICAYLLFEKIQHDAEAALHFFRSVRTTDLDAVNNPSQERYVRLYASLLAAKPERIPWLITGRTITIVAITLSSAPASLYAGGGSSAAAAAAAGPTAATQAAAAAAAAAAPASATASSASDAAAPATAAKHEQPSPLADGTVDGTAATAFTPPASDGSGGLSAITSLVLPSWHLKLSLSNIASHDTAEGVRSTRTHICSVGPLRCGPSQPAIRFELPNGGLRARGDLQLSLLSAAGLVRDDDQLGWVHLHTSWMPEGGSPQPAAAAAAASAAESSSGLLRVATLRKSEVDGIGKDGRFPTDWKMEIHFTCDELDDPELVVVDRNEAAPAVA